METKQSGYRPQARSMPERALRLAVLIALLQVVGLSHAATVYVEEMTWTEVRDAMAAGATTVIIYAGSTEQNGPHMVTGKHNVVSREVAGRMAAELGDALVFPVLPFAITGDISRRTGHMAFPGTVSLQSATFRAVMRDMAASAISAGARYVFIGGDHGGGQAELRSVAASLDIIWRRKGVRVFHLSDPYLLQWERAVDRAKSLGLAPGGHAGLVDTSELLALDAGGRLVRRDRLASLARQPTAVTGIDGDPSGASEDLGRAGIDDKVSLGVAQIRRLRGR